MEDDTIVEGSSLSAEEVDDLQIKVDESPRDKTVVLPTDIQTSINEQPTIDIDKGQQTFSDEIAQKAEGLESKKKGLNVFRRYIRLIVENKKYRIISIISLILFITLIVQLKFFFKESRRRAKKGEKVINSQKVAEVIDEKTDPSTPNNEEPRMKNEEQTSTQPPSSELKKK
ncbi:MAG: hypothetical protein V1872_05700 [bacterium]